MHALSYFVLAAFNPDSERSVIDRGVAKGQYLSRLTPLTPKGHTYSNKPAVFYCSFVLVCRTF